MEYIMKLQSKISLEPKLLLDIIENMSTAVVALNNDREVLISDDADNIKRVREISKGCCELYIKNERFI